MNAQDSISGFFYNLIPGVLFILGILYLFNGIPLMFFLFKHSEGLVITLVVTFGLFLGFFFQGIAKIKSMRENFDKNSRNTVRIKNKEIYKEAKKELSKIINIGIKKIKQKKFFYLMYNYLRGTGHAETAMFFTERASLWSNLFFGSCFYLLILVFFILCKYFNGALTIELNQKVILLFLILLGLIHFSRTMLIEHLRIFNEVTLLTYISVIKHSDKKVR